MKWISNGILAVALAVCIDGGVHAAAGQDASPAPKRVTITGSVAVIDATSLTLKTDAGADVVVSASDDTRMLQTVPGQKDLSTATPIHLTDLQVGDRVMAKGVPSEDGKSYAATLIVAIKLADIAQKQQHEREEWQRHGVGGLVKSFNESSGTVIISATAMGATRLIAVHTTSSTITRRYAPDSIDFNDARPAPPTLIKPGDQLRARGTRSDDGSELEADEIVSGTFRNVIATVLSTDAAAGTITAKDLVTKMPVVIRVAKDSQLRKLPPMMAMGIAMRMKGAGATGGNGAGPRTASSGPGGTTPGGAVSGGMPQGGDPAGTAGSGAPGEAHGGPDAGTQRGPRGPGDLQQALSRAPLIQLSDLNKGDAIMVVATEGSPTTPATVVTLLAGVEPMFQASASGSQSMLQSSWNLGGGGDVPQ